MKKSILLLSLLIGTQTPLVQADMSTGTKVALAVGGIVAGFAIYKLVQICWPSDERVIARGEELLEQCTQFNHKPWLVSMHPLPSAATVSEETLATLADHYSTLEGIAHLVPLLKKQSDVLAKRIPSLEGKDDSSLRYMATIMRKQQKHIQTGISDFEVYALIYEVHRDYFSLKLLASKLLTVYTKELAVVENQTVDTLRVEKVIGEAVIANNRSKSHPFVEYIKQINQDRSLLQTKIPTITGKYASLTAQCNELLHQLDNIATIVQADQRYSFEVYRKEQEERDRKNHELLQTIARSTSRESHPLRYLL